MKRRSIAVFCSDPGCSCGCPEMFLDESAPAATQVAITDDFGCEIRMSRAQFSTLVAKAKAGELDRL